MQSVITIDGPSGSGKGTISRLLARDLNYSYLDTGALYRAVAWKIKEEKVDPDDEAAMDRILKEIDINLSSNSIAVNGVDVTTEIRTGEIGELSSQVSAKPAVRERLFQLQREICLHGMVVIEGRDTGTTIFPEAGNKFFLDADVKERARRRYEELKEKSTDITLEQTIEDIEKRDARDSSRETSPLKQTDEMIYIDSTGLNITEVVAKIKESLK
ncbi:MAG TPA: (d)CMP kinase [Nitrospirae bacterium]|nr:cytidylate kinase [bacterium BMS3Abin09]GBE40951.1 cytidylate kinase [bacterium BMS3Bbin09]HDN95284.1 (d)CMP kinase [Nitrospirota bacterium]HDO67290.1 (d)CMP kinase [Nitrospirota bacterium]HDZ84556.1 (d)CMP kinase [Nitrospirota bacterium]